MDKAMLVFILVSLETFFFTSSTINNVAVKNFRLKKKL